MSILENAVRTWTPHPPAGEVICGDMPGDSVRIGEEHIRKACVLMPALFPLLCKSLEDNRGRSVISVFGGSGVGKSEIASLIACYLREAGIEVDYFEFRLLSGDLLLLCSDGLYGMVSDGEMLDCIRCERQPEPICRALMALALERGAKDNVTVLAVSR